MNRLVFLLHRYLGIALGLIVAMWCLSGIVMMYVEYPELAAEDEVAALPPLNLEGCCILPPIDRPRPIEDLRIEMLAETPVLRLTYPNGTRETFDLSTGRPVGGFGPAEASEAARAFAAVAGLPDFKLDRQLERDQWTVYGAYDVHRPLFRFSADDAAGTEWYVSSGTGEVIQITTAQQRFWNWLGAVPHWLYPTVLRQHTYLWSQLVIWLTIVGTFLTTLGVYVGIRQFRSRRSGRRSPYRGAALWHHYAGLVFGALMLTWLVSGFFSMNPWGALESRSFEPEISRQRGTELTLDQTLRQEIASLAATGLPEGATRLQAHVVGGQRFFTIWERDGNRSLPGEAIGEVMPFTDDAIYRASARIRPNVAVTEEGWIEADDAYYFSHHEVRELPVYRIIYADGERFYLDALTGDIVYAADRNRQLYRWLHYALHRGDFSAFIRERPIWDVFLLPLMLGVSLSALTGSWIGLRRIRRWFGSRRKREFAARAPLDLSSAG